MNNWWTNSSFKEFEKRTHCLVDQYNKYAVYDSHVRNLSNVLINRYQSTNICCIDVFYCNASAHMRRSDVVRSSVRLFLFASH